MGKVLPGSRHAERAVRWRRHSGSIRNLCLRHPTFPIRAALRLHPSLHGDRSYVLDLRDSVARQASSPCTPRLIASTTYPTIGPIGKRRCASRCSSIRKSSALSMASGDSSLPADRKQRPIRHPPADGATSPQGYRRAREPETAPFERHDRVLASDVAGRRTSRRIVEPAVRKARVATTDVAPLVLRRPADSQLFSGAT